MNIYKFKVSVFRIKLTEFVLKINLHFLELINYEVAYILLKIIQIFLGLKSMIITDRRTHPNVLIICFKKVLKNILYFMCVFVLRIFDGIWLKMGGYAIFQFSNFKHFSFIGRFFTVYLLSFCLFYCKKRQIFIFVCLQIR